MFVIIHYVNKKKQSMDRREYIEFNVEIEKDFNPQTSDIKTFKSCMHFVLYK